MSASNTYGSSLESPSASGTVSSSCVYSNLTADAPTPDRAIVDGALTFTATIRNIGTASTGAIFNNFFQISTEPNMGGTVEGLPSVPMAALAAGTTNDMTTSHVFTQNGRYYIRACADKSSAGDAGTIPELTVVPNDEDDNCGLETPVDVYSTVTYDRNCSTPECSGSAPSDSLDYSENSPIVIQDKT